MSLADGNQDGRWIVGTSLDSIDEQAAFGAAVGCSQQVTAQGKSRHDLLMGRLRRSFRVNDPHHGSANVPKTPLWSIRAGIFGGELVETCALIHGSP